MSDTLYWIWLALCLTPGSKQLHYLLDRYSSAYEIFRADEEELERLELSPRLINALCNKDMTEAYAINDYCASHKIGIISYDHEYYPVKLKLIPNPPPVLYFRGTFPNLNNRVALGIVGTRKMSEYGKRMAYKISYELASAEAIVVSGMALGSDAVAACGAISAGGKTVAVLGSGVDVIYPPEHARLYENIIQNGCVISEYPPTSASLASHFPQRNRIISGISSGTLVVECDIDSGAMITASCAIEQGKDLFALPGNVGDKNSTGTNKLIREGAIMVSSADDILREYEFYYGKLINYLALSIARGSSDVNDDNLRSMNICTEDYPLSRRRGKKKTEDPKNILIPRRIPKISDEGSLPTTLSEDDIKTQKNENQKGRTIDEELADLDEIEREILLLMPDDRAIGVDEIAKSGLGCSEIMGTMAILEIKGFVSSLPGGLYVRN